LHIEENSGAESWQIGVDVDGDLGFHNSATAAASVTFNDSGNVGIGISPLYKLHISGTSGSNILRVQDTGNNSGIGIGADATNGAEINYGGVDILRFVNVSTERMRIDSAGNVGIGVSPSSEFHVKGDANTVARIEPNNNTGKATLLVSSSGSGDGGMQYDANLNKMHIFSYSDMSFNVGTGNLSGNYPANERMRILSSGGITFNGDTAAANALDDYEEGTHTATITPTGGSVTMNSSVDDLAYVKIGRQVTVTGMITVASVSSPTGYFNISLPFSIGSWGGSYGKRCTGSLWINPKTGGGNVADYIVYGIQGESQFRVYLGDTTSIQADSAQTLYATVDIILSITYLTN